MPLVERLTGIGHVPATHGARIPISVFCAMLAERIRGEITNAQLITALQLTPDDVDDLRGLVRRVIADRFDFEEPRGRGGLERLDEIRCVLTLAEASVAPYETVAAVRSRLSEA